MASMYHDAIMEVERWDVMAAKWIPYATRSIRVRITPKFIVSHTGLYRFRRSDNREAHVKGFKDYRRTVRFPDPENPGNLLDLPVKAG